MYRREYLFIYSYICFFLVFRFPPKQLRLGSLKMKSSARCYFTAPSFSRRKITQVFVYTFVRLCWRIRWTKFSPLRTTLLKPLSSSQLKLQTCSQGRFHLLDFFFRLFSLIYLFFLFMMIFLVKESQCFAWLAHGLKRTQQ